MEHAVVRLHRQPGVGLLVVRRGVLNLSVDTPEGRPRLTEGDFHRLRLAWCSVAALYSTNGRMGNYSVVHTHGQRRGQAVPSANASCQVFEVVQISPKCRLVLGVGKSNEHDRRD